MTKPKLEILTDVVVKAICHHCGAEFEAHPFLLDGAPVVFPSWVCKKCKEEDDG